MATKQSSSPPAYDEAAVETPVEPLPAPTEAHPAADTAPPPSLTVEEWATRKGMLPMYRQVAAPFARRGGAMPKELNPDFEKYAQAKAHFAWPTGKELAEADFDAAVVKATTQIYR